MTSEDGIRVHVDLPNHPAIAGETLWADHVGDDVYRVANVPFWAYGLNHGDLVRATPDTEGVLTIREVVEPGGHRTLRLIFEAALDRARQEDLLGRIYVERSITFERANDRLVAVDVWPDADYRGVFEQLEAWADSGLLDFETCDPRVEGSFDDVPPDR